MVDVLPRPRSYRYWIKNIRASTSCTALPPRAMARTSFRFRPNNTAREVSSGTRISKERFMRLFLFPQINKEYGQSGYTTEKIQGITLHFPGLKSFNER